MGNLKKIFWKKKNVPSSADISLVVWTFFFATCCYIIKPGIPLNGLAAVYFHHPLKVGNIIAIGNLVNAPKRMSIAHEFDDLLNVGIRHVTKEFPPSRYNSSIYTIYFHVYNIDEVYKLTSKTCFKTLTLDVSLERHKSIVSIFSIWIRAWLLDFNININHPL